ncbi:DUF1120 domain-containing protein [Citrobacter freundii]|uniref:DUF1120 domain-containing protein n=1 Tax=Citrobacter gillenii TaxID=67828 RepID=UPI0015EA2B4F|nr:DUF1120 domain-containing protein [Citrobacter freundii]QLY71299.1 DUF1120 domain-containing protein [Citrobacter freundii]
MKKLLLAASLGAALLTSFNASASSDVTLKVTGSIIPGACVPTLPNGGVVDYGTIRNALIDPTSTTNKLVQLGQKSLILTVTCDTEIAVGITSADNRSGTNIALNSGSSYIENTRTDGGTLVTTSNGFGLGQAPNGVNIGAYSISFDTNSITADGNAVDLLTTGDVNTPPLTWTKSNGSFCSTTSGCTDSARALSVAETGTLVPKAFKVLTAPLLVAAAVQDNSILGTDDTITLDGNTTISLVYL